MIYFTPPSTPGIRAAIAARPDQLGAITTPAQGNKVPDGAAWIADNGYGPRADGTPAPRRPEAEWFAWLETRPWDKALCRFAVAPDHVGDAAATRTAAAPWLPRIRALGYPAAYVLQDGETDPPWDDLDALFVGGSTAYKLSPQAARWAHEAADRGKWVHVGRVNSVRRFTHAWTMRADSVDGTLLTRGPDVHMHRIRLMHDTLGGVQ